MRIVFEFEQREDALTPQLLKTYWPEEKDEDEAEKQNRQQGLESEVALVTAIKTQPEVLRSLWRQEALNWLHALETYQVAKLVETVAPDAVELQPLVAQLPKAAQAYFERPCLLDAYDSEPLIDYILNLDLCGVRIEDEQGVLLSSDDAPIRQKRKRK